MKKLLSVLLALVLIVSLSVVTVSADEAQESPTLTVLGYEWVSDYFAHRETQYEWQAAEKLIKDAGINIDYEIIVDRDQYTTTIQTRLASGHDLPDLFYGGRTDVTTLLDLADMGIVLKINPILEITKGNAYNFYYGGTGDQARRLISDVNGDFYWLPKVGMSTFNGELKGTSIEMVIRKDWLDKLGLDMPNSLESYADALQAFRDNDMNGNGAADEVCVLDTSYFDCGFNLWYGIPTCNSESIGIDLTEQTVQSAWYNPNLKAYFTYVRDMVEKGLVSADFIGSDSSMDALMSNNAVSSLSNYSMATWDEANLKSLGIEDALYLSIYPFDAVEGTKAFYSEGAPYMAYLRYCVSNTAEDKLETVARYFDVIYSDEMSNIFNRGVEGKTYQVEEDGSITKLNFAMTNDEKFEKGLLQIDIFRYFMPMYAADERTTGEIPNTIKSGYPEKAQYDIDTNDYYPRTPNSNSDYFALPTAEEDEIIAKYSTDLSTASRELATNISLGNIAIDDIDAEVENLRAMGLDEVLAVRTAQYNRAIGK